MKRHLRYILTFLFGLISVFIYPYNRTFRSLTATEGLSDLVVNELYKDSQGYMWIGTGKTLERFDGAHIKRYDILGADERLKRVYAIAELPDNELWMGNGMGLWRINKLDDKLEAIARETVSGAVYSLLYGKDGTLYIGSSKGLFIYRSGNIEQVLVDSNILAAANTIYAMDLSRDGMLWLATEGGLYSMSLSERKFAGYHNLEEGEHICRFVDMARIGSRIYLATQEHGILCFDIHSHKFSHYVDVGCNVISSLSGDGERMLYVGTDGNGIKFIDTETDEIVYSQRYDASRGKNDLRSNSVYSLLVDRDGLIWVGYYQQGLDYTLYQNDLFTTYVSPSLLDTRNMAVRSILIRGDEKLIGSRDGLFFVDEKGGRFKNYATPQLRSNMIFCSLYHEGEYYIGTYGGGMYVLNPQTLQIRDFETKGTEVFQKGHIFCIKKDVKGMVWIGTSDGIFCYHNGIQTAHYTTANSKLPSNMVYEIYFDSTHKGWICTEHGMCIWEPSAKMLRTDVFPEGFVHKEKIRVVYEDSRHQLYFCPDKGYMFKSDLLMTTFHRLSPDTPVDVMFVTEDKEGWLWIGTNNGIYRYDKKDVFIPFHFIDGIPDPVFTLCPPVTDEKGDIWMANSKGLLRLDLAGLSNRTKSAYPMRITEVKRLGTSSVAFRFSDFSYTYPASMLYEYCLEEKENAWMPLNGRSEVIYYDLPAGNYTFKVRRLGESDTQVQVKNTIKSSSGSWWIMIVLALVAVLGVWMWKKPHSQKKEESASLQAKRVEDAVEEMPVTEETSEEKLVVEEKYKTNRVSTEDCKRLVNLLEKYMKQEKPYTQPDLKISDLAAAIGTSSHSLSYVFNQYLNCNYYDYINDYRIKEFKRLVNTEESSKYTLAALSELCGFKSRASFFRSFKKVTGITPNDYIRNKSLK